MRIIKTKSYEEMSKKAANIIASVVTLKPDCMLGLATGSSPIGTYDELVKKYEAGDLDFSEVTTVNLDEYKGLPKENEQSYYYFMHEYLFDKVNINPNCIIFFHHTVPCNFRNNTCRCDRCAFCISFDDRNLFDLNVWNCYRIIQ